MATFSHITTSGAGGNLHEQRGVQTSGGTAPPGIPWHAHLRPRHGLRAVPRAADVGGDGGGQRPEVGDLLLLLLFFFIYGTCIRYKYQVFYFTICLLHVILFYFTYVDVRFSIFTMIGIFLVFLSSCLFEFFFFFFSRNFSFFLVCVLFVCLFVCLPFLPRAVYVGWRRWWPGP